MLCQLESLCRCSGRSSENGLKTEGWILYFWAGWLAGWRFDYLSFSTVEEIELRGCFARPLGLTQAKSTEAHGKGCAIIALLLLGKTIAYR